jgi:hypothetical protein
MKDILVNSDFDLETYEGDFRVGDSTNQNQAHLLSNQPGELPEHPVTGVGLASWLNDERNGGMLGEVRRQFKADGMQVNSVEIINSELKIDASY